MPGIFGTNRWVAMMTSGFSASTRALFTFVLSRILALLSFSSPNEQVLEITKIHFIVVFVGKIDCSDDFPYA
jgi:hypothetical protein